MPPHRKLSKHFGFTASCDWFYRLSFTGAGLRSLSSDLGDGTIMHCWVPRTSVPSKPNLLLVHGFGANAMWQYERQLRHFTPTFNVYVPDLLFFGESYTTRPERSETFQAQCMGKLMEACGVRKLSYVGISYGGFVGYSLAAQYPEMVEKIVLCCSGVCLEEKDMENGLFVVSNVDDAADILVPQTPDRLKELMRFAFVKPATYVPAFFLTDFINVMCRNYVEEKKELIRTILRGRKLSNLPRITQPTMIIWGEEDQIFPIELAHRLQRHVASETQLVIIKNAGHGVNLEKGKEFTKHLKAFLMNAHSLTSSSSSQFSLKEFLHRKDD